MGRNEPIVHRYDYIIVGGGSAGCVVAARLSEDRGVKVLLIEAGGADRHLLMPMPLACGQIFYDPTLNWGFETEPEPFADNRVLNRAAGKVIGGGSSINGMMYTRGHPRDYDQWAQLGCAGWSHADVLPYFKRAESNWRGTTEDHGGEGPLSVSRHFPDAAFAKIAETARRHGYPVSDDFERDTPDGFGVTDFTTHRGRRASTARRYLYPALRRGNLTLMSETQTTRLLFDGHKAIGVEVVRGGAVGAIHADCEVILSAGAYGSPKLLLLSGIGPADDLRALGLKVVRDLPGVGQNLQDHPGAALTFRPKDRLPFDRQIRLDRLMLSVIQWGLTGRGVVSGLPFTAVGFCRTRPELERPDLEFLFSPASMDARVWFPGWRRPISSNIGVTTWLMRQQSRGWVKLRSSDPMAKPRILLNVLADPRDGETLLKGLRMLREFMATEPAASLVTDELIPGPEVQNDDALAAHIRRVIRTAQHPVGACAMGNGHEAVVDAELKVRGVSDLRVIDASIMPVIVGGHTNAPTIMIGEKGADLVRGRAHAIAGPADAA
jgi:choline dehydrogenase